MESPSSDFLLEVCSRADDSTLEALSHTSLWPQILDLAQTQYFWYLRAQHLVKHELVQRPNRDWREAYRSLERALVPDVHLELAVESDLALEVLLELGFDLAVNNNLALKRAVSRGSIESVKLLLQDDRVDSELIYKLMLLAVKNNRLEVLRLLLSDPRSPQRSFNGLAERAYARQYDDIVLLLLKDDRTDQAQFDRRLPRLARQRARLARYLPA